jgi:hypothetical protein
MVGYTEVILPPTVPPRCRSSPKCMVLRLAAREKRRADRQICANVFGLCVESGDSLEAARFEDRYSVGNRCSSCSVSLCWWHPDGLVVSEPGHCYCWRPGAMALHGVGRLRCRPNRTAPREASSLAHPNHTSHVQRSMRSMLRRHRLSSWPPLSTLPIIGIDEYLFECRFGRIGRVLPHFLNCP